MVSDLWRVVLAPATSTLMLAICAFTVGWSLAPRWLRQGPRLRSLALAFPIGLAAVATAAFLGSLARLGTLAGVALLLVVLAPSLWRDRSGLFALAEGFGWLRRSPAEPSVPSLVPGPRSPVPPARWPLAWIAAGALALGAAAAPAWLALYPSTGFDANTYHLPLAERLARADGDLFDETLRFPTFPLLAESIWGLVQPLGGDRAAQGCTVLVTLATALLLFAWGRERLCGWWSVVPAALWLGHPIVARYAATAYVEPWSAMFAVAGFYAADLAGAQGYRAWLLAGLCSGWAVSTKHLGWLVAAALGPWSLVGRGRARGVLMFSIGLAAATLVFVGWMVAATGNPLFPYASRWFGSSAWGTEAMATSVATSWPGISPASERLLMLWRLPWELVIDRARVGQQPPYLPMVLLVFPALVWAAVRFRSWVVPAAGLVVAQLLAFPFLPPDSRYLMPAVALLGLLVAAAGQELLRARVGQRVALVMVLLGLLAGPAYTLHRIARIGWPPLTAGGEAELFAAWSLLAPAVDFVNRESAADSTVYLVGAEHLRHLAQRRVLGEWSGPFAFQRVVRLAARPNQLDRVLGAAGVDLVLWPLDPRFPRLVPHPRWRVVYQDSAAVLFALERGQVDDALPR